MGVPLPESQQWQTRGDAVVCCRIVAVENPHATNGYPPRISIEVEQTLRGPMTAAGKLRVLWAPGDDFYAMRSGPQALRAWQAVKLDPPPVGERYLAVLEGLGLPPNEPGGPALPGEPAGATVRPAARIPAGLRRPWSEQTQAMILAWIEGRPTADCGPPVGS